MAEKTVATPVEQQAPAVQEATRAEDRHIAPPVDIFEDKDGLVVVADLPGATTEALDVRVDQGVLTIEARTGHVAPGTPIHREYQLVSFFRQFQLPERVSVAQIGADLKNGVLTLHLPWAPEVRPRSIQVKSG
jgi:HSP20 family protein